MILERLFRSSPTLENPSTPITGGTLEDILGERNQAHVTPTTAMQLAAVYACVYVLSSALAQLPLHVMRKDGKKVEAARDHALFYLLHDSPNPWQTSYKMREYNQSAVLLHGNAYLHIQRNHKGEITALESLEPWQVTLLKNGSRYTYGYYGDNETRSVNPDDMIHIKALGSSIKLGKSLIQQHAETIGLGVQAKQFASSFFGSNARPTGIVTAKKELNTNAWNNLKAMWRNAQAELQKGENKTVLLPAEMDYRSITISPVDTELLAMMKLNRSEIAGIFNVPAHMINDLEKATFSNISEQTIQFIRYSLMPWIVNWEQEINRKVFTQAERKAGFFVKFNLSGIMRGTPTERSQFYHNAITDGWLSRNEARALEDLNPVDGLDEYLVSVNAAQPVKSEPSTENEPND